MEMVKLQQNMSVLEKTSVSTTLATKARVE